MVFTDEVDRGIDVIIWKVIVIPEKVEQLVKKLEKHEDDIESPWGLATYMKKKGYKMPAAEDPARELRKTTEKQWDAPEPAPKKPKQTRPVGDLYSSEEYNMPPTPDVGPIKLPTEKDWGEAKTFADKLTSKRKSLGLPDAQKANEEEDPLVYPDEFKMGMKEEGKEHADVVDADKEKIKKIVLAHLKEDPHYYTKLGTVMKAEEEDQLKWTPKPPKAKPVEPVKQSPKDAIESFLHVHQAEEEGIMDKIKSTVKDLTVSPKVAPYQKPPPLTKKNVRQNFQHQHGASAEEGGMDYVKEIQSRKKPVVPEKYDPKLTEPTHTEPAVRTPKRKSWGLAQEAEEALGESQKAFDEDALNELYMFLEWLHNKGFKAEDGDQFEALMDRFDVERFAEEAQPPAEFKAPEEKPTKFTAPDERK